MSLSPRKKIEFVYDLPYAERMELCKILDLTDKWEILASLMGYDVMTIRSLRRARHSQTDELLTEWGHKNGTVLKLFGFLSQMQHYQAMLCLKRFVDPEYHRLIYEGKGMLSQAKRPSYADEATASKAPISFNFNQSNSCNTLPSKMDGIRMSNTTSSNAESKILNVDAPQVVQPRRGSGSGPSQAPTLRVNNNSNDARKSPTGESSRAKASSPDLSMGVDSGPPMIKYKELEIATNGWDQNAILGKGGFGIVYKGTWKNTPVAVKRTLAKDVDGSATIQMQQILAELRMLNAYRHDSILPLYGYSIDGEDPCLIYQFMPNGSLEDRLLCRRGTDALTWTQRLHIATETARGLQWLHTIKDKSLIHGDIKSANILLDSNFQPKIGDFGLAREGPQSQYTHMKISKIHGTRPYLPDEFLRARKFSTKVDTHCFGIVLFELATGLRPYDDQRSHKYLRDLIEQSNDGQITHLIDRKAMPSDPHIFLVLIDLGRLCVKHKPKERPEMVTVLQALEGATAQRVRVQASSRAVSPLALQHHYDQLSQQRNHGAQYTTPPRVNSPLPMRISPSPELRAITPIPEFLMSPSSPVGRISPNDIRPILDPATPGPSKMTELRLGPVSPFAGAVAPPSISQEMMGSQSGAGLSAVQEYSVSMLPATLLPVVNTPEIAVTPPTNSSTYSRRPAIQSTSSINDTDNLTEPSLSSAVQTDTSIFEASDFNIPNLAALGIDGEEAEDAAQEEIKQDVVCAVVEPAPTTAKGKTLWIMNG